LGLGGWLVRAEKEDAIFFSSTDSLGFYDLQVDTGTYEVTLLQQNDRWEICNPIAFSVQFDTPYDSARSDFVLIPELDCPLLDVELSASPAIACDVQSLNISYGNQGTSLATDVQVTLELDDLLSYISSSVPVSAQDGQLLTFDLPDLPVGGRQSFTVNAAVACTGLENQQSISSQANILPVEDCAPVDPDWDMSSIEVTSTCDGDSIRFFITNISDNDMTGQLEYIVIEDQVMVIPPTPFDPLDASQGFEAVTLPANGSTYRMIAQQVPGHPGNQFPTAFVEGCGENENGNFTTGQVAQFADNDGDLNIDILTQEVLVLNTNVDLALRAYPKGYQDSIITPNTDLEYTIFFPLDSDEITIGRVVIRDTLSTLLDLNSLEMGAASHPYDFTLYQNGVLKITFDSIQLHAGGGTGGAGNALGQQGYVSFRLSQKPNNALGDVISNRAAVYFDYRSPMITNSVRHVVDCQELLSSDCLLTNSTNYPVPQGVNISVFPNPMTAFTTVKVEGWKKLGTQFELSITDAFGRQVYQTTFTGDQVQVARQNLPAAAYFYELRGDGLLIGNGKLFVQ
ncbi:MAG: T9SS type A sorting domain-containing protein, partial [Bacteroidota bacterium]